MTQKHIYKFSVSVMMMFLSSLSITNAKWYIWNLYCTFSEKWHGVRMKSWSGMKKPSSCPISSSNITPSANWTQRAEFSTVQRSCHPRGRACLITFLLHCQSWKQQGLFVFFTCVSISTTCKPMVDTFWLIKCKMAWREKINRST